MTVYNEKPLAVAEEFAAAGAKYLHLVDLEGAKTGETPNLETVCKIVKATDMFIELGGGIRSIETAEKYLNAGVNRVILGTAAVTQEGFAQKAVQLFGDKIAVGVDIKDGFVAVKGWTEKSDYTCELFCRKMQSIGVKTVICTDISRDGAMKGTNRQLYGELSKALSIDITASGGVSSLDDVKALAAMKLYGAIIGKAYYTGAIDLAQAIAIADGGLD